jgi:hypothetical protein
MPRIDKTIFLSYRRADIGWALAVFQDLTKHGYDVFFDFQGIASGDFERVILANITARAHFLLLLTPSALERCQQPNDWLRHEIEAALANRRNIIPVALQGFDFARPAISVQLTGSLAPLSRYNALAVPDGYFDEAMARLREKYLNIPLEAVLHAPSADARKATESQQAAAAAALQEPSDLSRFVASVRIEEVPPGQTNFDPSGLKQLEQELAMSVGPVAKVMLKRAVKRAASWTDLYHSLAVEIPEGAERKRFLKSAAAMQKRYPI